MIRCRERRGGWLRGKPRASGDDPRALARGGGGPCEPCAGGRVGERPVCLRWSDRLMSPGGVPGLVPIWTSSSGRSAAWMPPLWPTRPRRNPPPRLRRSPRRPRGRARPDSTRSVDYFTNTSGVMQDKAVARPSGSGRATACSCSPRTASIISLAGTHQAADTAV